MNKGKVKLNSYLNEGADGAKFEYHIEHNNGSTSLDQLLTIESVDNLFNQTWVAKLNFDEFAPQQTPKDAALKLAEWMERLAATIRSGEYLNIHDESEFKDLG